MEPPTTPEIPQLRRSRWGWGVIGALVLASIAGVVAGRVYNHSRQNPPPAPALAPAETPPPAPVAVAPPEPPGVEHVEEPRPPERPRPHHSGPGRKPPAVTPPPTPVVDGTLRLRLLGEGVAKVVIDDKERGVAPQVLSFPLAPGIHHLRLERNGTVLLERQVTVAPGEQSVVPVDFGNR